MTRALFFFLLVVFALLHHDFWLWSDTSLVFGFLPAGLAYHTAYCFAVGLLWWFASRYFWPIREEKEFRGRGR